MNPLEKIMEFIHRGENHKTVHVGVSLDRPLQGITKEAPKDTTHIKVTGITLEQASLLLPGKSLDWAKIPRTIRDALELIGFLEITWSELKRLLKAD